MIEVNAFIRALGADLERTANPLARGVREGRDEILASRRDGTAWLVPSLGFGCLDYCKLILGERLAGGIPNLGEVGVFVFEMWVFRIFQRRIERPLCFCKCGGKCADGFGLIHCLSPLWSGSVQYDSNKDVAKRTIYRSDRSDPCVAMI